MTKSTSLFIESIFINEGNPLNLKWHQQRVEKTFKKYFPEYKPFSVIESITGDFTGLQKCRITYSSYVEKIELEPFIPKEIKTLKIVKSGDFDYAYKFANRDTLNSLRNQRENCDDILISIYGYLTDTSFANIVLFDGENYYTPDPPLLYGTKRAQLLEKNIIKPIAIKETDLPKFQELHMINALANLGEYVVNIEDIRS